MKLSIIIPCYNVEKYVLKCLDSLTNISCSHEILVINDGSTDNTLTEIKKSKNPFLKVYSIENSGLSDCRNYGLNLAKGEYIYFLDSDDYINSDVLNEMISLNCDLVIAGVNSIYQNKIINTYEPTKENLYLQPFWVWNKLFKHEIILKNNLQFKSKTKYEDIYFCLDYYQHIKDLKIINKILIFYVQHESSISANYINQKEYLKALKYLEPYLDDFSRNLYYHKYAITNVTKFQEKSRIKDCYHVLKKEKIPYFKYQNEITKKQKIILFLLYKNKIFLKIILFFSK